MPAVHTRVLKSFVEEIFEIAGRRGTLEFGTFVQAKEGALSIRPDVSRMEAMTADLKSVIRSAAVSRK